MRILALIITGMLFLNFVPNLKIEDNYFEGQIIYKQSYLSDKPIDVDSLLSKRTNGSVYLINQRFLKGLNYADDSAVFIFDGTTGKNLSKTINDELYSCSDNTQSNMPSPLFKKNDEIEIINGFRCKSYESNTNGRKSIQYYSLDYKMNPVVYSKYSKWNWKQTMEYAEGGIGIKSIYFKRDYDLIIEITSLKEFKVKDKEFYIDKNMIKKGC